MLNLTSFWKLDACDQKVLPDRSILKGHKLVENAKIDKFKREIKVDKSWLKMPKIVNFGEFF